MVGKHCQINGYEIILSSEHLHAGGHECAVICDHKTQIMLVSAHADPVMIARCAFSCGRYAERGSHRQGGVPIEHPRWS